MFKSRRVAASRSKKTRLFARRHKSEGNSNITANRVTIPPGFLSLGVASNTVQKNSVSQRDCILAENLQGLFSVNLEEDTNNKPRRSVRISKQSDPSYEALTASEYFCKSLNIAKPGQSEDESTQLPHKGNNSKSLFRQINERCAKTNPTTFNCLISAVLDPNSKVERFQGSNFCQNLAREVSVDLTQYDYLRNAKLAISGQFRDINGTLQKKMDLGGKSPEKHRTMEADRGVDNFRYVPKSEWVFQTPPRQGVVPLKAEECAIQPAVICTARKCSNIYELNPNFKVDLTGFSNRQNVPVDGRYMKRLASFPEEGGFAESDQTDSDDDFVSRRSKPKKTQASSLTFHSVVSDIFAQVTCRPAKTTKKMPRLDNFYSRVSEGNVKLTPTGPNVFKSVDELQRDVTFVEDHGTFKMVSSQASKSEGNFDFKFRKNLFKGNDDKIFNFGVEEPKLFNFANLKSN